MFCFFFNGAFYLTSTVKNYMYCICVWLTSNPDAYSLAEMSIA